MSVLCFKCLQITVCVPNIMSLVQVGAMKCDVKSIQISVQQWTRFSWIEIWSSLMQPGLTTEQNWQIQEYTEFQTWRKTRSCDYTCYGGLWRM